MSLRDSRVWQRVALSRRRRVFRPVFPRPYEPDALTIADGGWSSFAPESEHPAAIIQVNLGHDRAHGLNELPVAEDINRAGRVSCEARQCCLGALQKGGETFGALAIAIVRIGGRPIAFEVLQPLDAA